MKTVLLHNALETTELVNQLVLGWLPAPGMTAIDTQALNEPGDLLDYLFDQAMGQYDGAIIVLSAQSQAMLREALTPASTRLVAKALKLWLLVLDASTPPTWAEDTTVIELSAAELAQLDTSELQGALNTGLSRGQRLAAPSQTDSLARLRAVLRGSPVIDHRLLATQAGLSDEETVVWLQKLNAQGHIVTASYAGGLVMVWEVADSLFQLKS